MRKVIQGGIDGGRDRVLLTPWVGYSMDERGNHKTWDEILAIKFILKKEKRFYLVEVWRGGNYTYLHWEK